MTYPRPHARFRPHTAMRPSTRCRACGAPWPCAPAKLVLLIAYRGNTRGLLRLLAERYLDALEDRPDLDRAELRTRIFGWLAGSTGRPPSAVIAENDADTEPSRRSATMTGSESGWLADIRTSYDTVADSYSDFTREALAGEPYLLAALSLFADLVHAAGGGPVADLGCGPGYVTAHLHKLGVDAFGIDLSPAMIDIARRDHPDLRFEVGSMTDLRLDDASVAALLAFWSLIHIPDDTIPTVLGHFGRVLRPGGPLMLGFHVGDESRLKTEGYGGHPMRVYVHRRQPDRVAGWLRDAGFAVQAQLLTNLDGSLPGAILFAHRRP